MLVKIARVRTSVCGNIEKSVGGGAAIMCGGLRCYAGIPRAQLLSIQM